jgi:hypothetical protein
MRSVPTRRWIMYPLVGVLLVCAAYYFLSSLNRAAELSGITGLDGYEAETRTAQFKFVVYGITWLLSEIASIGIMMSQMNVGDDLTPLLRLVARGLVATTIAGLVTLCVVFVMAALHLGWA